VWRKIVQFATCSFTWLCWNQWLNWNGRAAAAAAAAGIQGHRIYIDEDGDAEANYTVVALLPDDQQRDPEMAGKSLQPIGHFMLQQHDIPVRSRGEYVVQQLLQLVEYRSVAAGSFLGLDSWGGCRPQGGGQAW